MERKKYTPKRAIKGLTTPETNLNKLGFLKLVCDYVQQNPTKFPGVNTYAKREYVNYKKAATKQHSEERILETINIAKDYQTQGNNIFANPETKGIMDNKILRAVQRLEMKKRMHDTGKIVAGALLSVFLTGAAVAATVTNQSESEPEPTTAPPPPNEATMPEQTPNPATSHHPQIIIPFSADELDTEIATPTPMQPIGQFIETFASEGQTQIEYTMELIRMFEGTTSKGFSSVNKTDGLSAGMIQQNISPSAQTLNTMLSAYIKSYPDKAQSIFGNNLQELKLILDKSPEEIQIEIGSNYDLWAPLIAKMMGSTEGVQMQLDDINRRMDEANDLCDQYDLKTTRAFAFAFNRNVINGDTKNKPRAFGVLKDFDRENVDVESLWESYFEPKYKNLFKENADENFLNHKKNQIESMSYDEVVDYYMLNLVDDNHPTNRGRVILGLDYQNGQDGYTLYGSFRTVNTSILDTPRSTSANCLIVSLYDQGYNPTNDQLETLKTKGTDLFKFGCTNIEHKAERLMESSK